VTRVIDVPDSRQHGAGGRRLDYWYTVILVEELVRGRDLGCVVGLLVQCEMATAVIHEHGSNDLRRSWLVPAIRGERIAALGVSEPSGGSDVAALRTTARRDGDDYVINGSKIFISNGARAHFVTLAVRTGGPGPDGVSLVVCPTDAVGFQVSRRLEKVDLHSSDTVELFFDDVRIPRRNLVGTEGQGFRYIMQAFQGRGSPDVQQPSARARAGSDEPFPGIRRIVILTRCRHKPRRARLERYRDRLLRLLRRRHGSRLMFVIDRGSSWAIIMIPRAPRTGATRGRISCHRPASVRCDPSPSCSTCSRPQCW
jgi:hypothetical protein